MITALVSGGPWDGRYLTLRDDTVVVVIPDDIGGDNHQCPVRRMLATGRDGTVATAIIDWR